MYFSNEKSHDNKNSIVLGLICLYSKFTYLNVQLNNVSYIQGHGTRKYWITLIFHIPLQGNINLYLLMEVQFPWSIVILLVNINLGFYVILLDFIVILLDFIVIFIELMKAHTRINRWQLWTVTNTQCNLIVIGHWKLQIDLFSSFPYLFALFCVCCNASFYDDYLYAYTFVKYNHQCNLLGHCKLQIWAFLHFCLIFPTSSFCVLQGITVFVTISILTHLWIIINTQRNLFGHWKSQIWPLLHFSFLVPPCCVCGKASFYCDNLYAYKIILRYTWIVGIKTINNE